MMDEQALPTQQVSTGETSRPCPACSPPGESEAPTPVYALGTLQLRIPSLEVEKEIAQVTGRAETAGLTDQQALVSVLSERQNRYLARRMCWVLTIRGLETYLLTPLDSQDLDTFLESVRPTPGPGDLNLVIGYKGTIAPPEMCNGLMVPVVTTEQVYSFDRDSLIRAIPAPEGVPAREQERFRASAAEVFDRIMLLTDNAGDTDEHRAVNYVAVRYPGIYQRTAELHAANCSLRSVEAFPSRLSGTRKLVDVIFTYANRQTDFTEKFRVTVDVTGAFPFLVDRLQPFYEH